jgi:hypothetical protein
MLGRAGKQLGHFGWIHEIACTSEGELYVAEILNWGVQKLILEPANRMRPHSQDWTQRERSVLALDFEEQSNSSH